MNILPRMSEVGAIAPSIWSGLWSTPYLWASASSFLLCRQTSCLDLRTRLELLLYHVQRLGVILGQCCLRVAASPCLPNGPITQLSPYFTRNPCTWYLAPNFLFSSRVELLRLLTKKGERGQSVKLPRQQRRKEGLEGFRLDRKLTRREEAFRVVAQMSQRWLHTTYSITYFQLKTR